MSRRISVTAAADGVAILSLLALPFWAWSREGATADGEIPGLLLSDRFLYGPDAAAWAQNALALDQDRIADLDAHRMPTWTLLTVAVMKLTGWDVALSGHLLNRAMHVALGPVLYLLGRRLGLRGFAWLAALLAVAHPRLLASACRFGVDPTVTFFVPLALLLGLLGGRSLGAALVAGAMAGLATVSHLTALGFGLTAVAMSLAAGRGWQRWVGSIVVLFGAAVTIRGIFSVFPLLPEQWVVGVFAEGIAPTVGDPTGAAGVSSRDAALATLQARAPAATNEAIRYSMGLLSVSAIPWNLSLAMLWLGVLGPQVFRPVRGYGWRPRVAALFEGGLPGLVLLATCLPLVAFAAAATPERYRDNLLPVVALLLARGAATVVAAVVAAVSLVPALGRGRRELEASLSLVLALGWGWAAWNRPHARAPVLPPIEEQAALPVGRVLAEHFEPGTGGASPMREALPYAGLLYCPLTACPFNTGEASYLQCLEIMRKECRGTDDFAYVAAEGLTREQVSPARAGMDAWMATRLKPVASVGSTKIYAIPRTGPLPPP